MPLNARRTGSPQTYPADHRPRAISGTMRYPPFARSTSGSTSSPSYPSTCTGVDCSASIARIVVVFPARRGTAMTRKLLWARAVSRRRSAISCDIVPFATWSASRICCSAIARSVLKCTAPASRAGAVGQGGSGGESSELAAGSRSNGAHRVDEPCDVGREIGLELRGLVGGEHAGRLRRFDLGLRVVHECRDERVTGLA